MSFLYSLILWKFSKDTRKLKMTAWAYRYDSISAYYSILYKIIEFLLWNVQAKYDNSELELASIEQQRADADVLKLLADQEVCTLHFS